MTLSLQWILHSVFSKYYTQSSVNIAPILHFTCGHFTNALRQCTTANHVYVDTSVAITSVKFGLLARANVIPARAKLIENIYLEFADIDSGFPQQAFCELHATRQFLFWGFFADLIRIRKCGASRCQKILQFNFFLRSLGWKSFAIPGWQRTVQRVSIVNVTVC